MIHNQKGQLVIPCAKSLQSCPTLCDPIDGSPPGSPVPGILQARTLEWVAISFSSAWKWKLKVKSLSCVRSSDPMDCSLQGSSVHGIFQARVLEWVATAFSRLYTVACTNGCHKDYKGDWLHGELLHSFWWQEVLVCNLVCISLGG